jgi:hypothetical protein
MEVSTLKNLEVISGFTTSILICGRKVTLLINPTKNLNFSTIALDAMNVKCASKKLIMKE